MAVPGFASTRRPSPRLRVRVDERARRARVDGQVACVFGVRPVTFLGREGVPWMLGTPLVAQHARAFIKNSRPYIAQMLRAYPHLMNYVHAPNHQAIGWLKRMGFVLGPAVTAPTGEMFHPFEMRAPHV